MTHGVVTLWYRAPELLLGDEHYTEAIDIWSAGTIFAEMMLRHKLLQGRDENDQIHKIMDMFGGINPSNFEGCERLPFYSKINTDNYPHGGRHREVRPHPCPPLPSLAGLPCGQDLVKGSGLEGDPDPLVQVLRNLPPDAVDLIACMLTLDPRKRITAAQALQHPYFVNAPTACNPSELPKMEASHEYTTKKRDQKDKQQAMADASKRPRVEGATYPQQQQQKRRGYVDLDGVVDTY